MVVAGMHTARNADVDELLLLAQIFNSPEPEAVDGPFSLATWALMILVLLAS